MFVPCTEAMRLSTALTTMPWNPDSKSDKWFAITTTARGSHVCRAARTFVVRRGNLKSPLP